MTRTEEGQQTARLRELHVQGLSPKQIARTLGLRPSDVVAVLNQSAASPSSNDEQGLVRCWVSSGWGSEVLVNGHHDWPGRDDDVESPGGLVCVLVARRHRYDKVSVCGYLVDVHCLGVKNTIGPEVMDEVDLIAFRRRFFDAYLDHLAAPLQLARHLVLGAVAYARALGFEPHPDYADTSGHLDGPLTHCDIDFGCDGMPFYVEGPYDDVPKIIHTLETAVGPGNYHFLRSIPLPV